MPKRSYLTAKARGRCVQCVHPARPARVLCARCTLRLRARTQARHRYRRAQELCALCGRTQPTPGWACAECRAIRVVKNHERRARHAQAQEGA